MIPVWRSPTQSASPKRARVEAVSEAAEGRRSVPFIFSATVELFEQNGFQRLRQVGKHSWIVGRVIQPA
ncbi:hypothetical protein [Microlunatus endophyticus]|uniref:hypothetical protein n=1 Tax=Microlunatus endophyticus TaxID=1716077 RepID=UPI001E3AF3D0|nr:hypothetical protein [Microlunatus endophyticus]